MVSRIGICSRKEGIKIGPRRFHFFILSERFDVLELLYSLKLGIGHADFFALIDKGCAFHEVCDG